jgi:UDP-N-acetylglucosamine 4-epimerase
VTGGAGFIGSHLVEALLGQGRAVTVLDDFSSGSRTNLDGFQGDLRIVEGSIQSESDCRAAFEGVDRVSHQAAFGSVPRSIEHPELYSANNLHGSTVVLAEARRRGVRRVIMASSSSVYGDDAGLPKSEERLGRPLSPYAASKRSMELFAASMAGTANMSVACLRYFNVFGPRQNPCGPYAAVIPLFIRALLRGESVRIHGDGLQARDFTFVDNVVAANVAALDAPSCPDFRVYNIACGGSTTVNDLYRILRDLAGSELEAEHGPDRPGDIRDSLADVSRAAAELGYRPQVGLEEGLRLTLQWYRAEPGRIG